MIISTAIQGSQEWLTERAGNVSASNFGNIITATGKETSGKTRENYLYRLAAERLTGKPEDSFKSAAMERGNELEEDARNHFEDVTGLFVAQVGMVYLDELRQISCSPDGLVANDSGLEIKCPLAPNHIRYLDSGKLPTTYKPQVQGCLWVTGRESWRFMSYYPGLQPLIITVNRDEKYINQMAQAVTDFNNQVNELVAKIARKAA